MNIFYTTASAESASFAKRVLRDFYGILTPKFEKNAFGKPFLTNFPLFFNLSHSENVTAIAVHAGEVGLDIEKNAVCGREKIKSRLAEEERREDFYRVWTAKEAYIKYRGESLARLYSKLEYKNGVLYEQNSPVAAVFFHTEIEGCTLTACTADKTAVELIKLN